MSEEQNRKQKSEYADIRHRLMISFAEYSVFLLFFYTLIDVFFKGVLSGYVFIPSIILSVIAYITYTTIMISSSRRRTFLQGAFSYRVLSNNGKRLDFKLSLRRSLFGVVGIFSLGLLNISTLTDRKNRTYADQKTESVVVKKLEDKINFIELIPIVALVLISIIISTIFKIEDSVVLSEKNSISEKVKIDNNSKNQSPLKPLIKDGGFRSNLTPLYLQAEQATASSEVVRSLIDSYYQKHKAFPTLMPEDVMSRVNWDPTATIKYGGSTGRVEIHIATPSSRATITYRPSLENDVIVWKCGAYGMDDEDLPTLCKKLRSQ